MPNLKLRLALMVAAVSMLVFPFALAGEDDPEKPATPEAEEKEKSGSSEIRWLNDYDSAFDEARERGVPLFILFAQNT